MTGRAGLAVFLPRAALVVLGLVVSGAASAGDSESQRFAAFLESA